MTPCVVCLRESEDGMRDVQLCTCALAFDGYTTDGDCLAEKYDSEADGWTLTKAIAWAAKRARRFAYEDAAQSLEMMAGGFHLDAKATKWEERYANERAEQVLREAAAAIRAKAGK